MKKYLFGLIAIAFLFIVPDKVMAATTIAQADFTSAFADTPSNGVSYDTTNNWFTLAAGEYTLSEDIDLSIEQLVISNNVTLNLAGFEITSATGSNSESTILVTSNAEVTITGNGEVTSTDDGYAIRTANESQLTIENGTFVGGIVTEDDSVLIVEDGAFDFINTYGDSILTISAGTFTDPLYFSNDSVVSIEDGEFAESVNVSEAATLVITGGTFDGQVIATDEAALGIDGGTFNNEVRFEGANIDHLVIGEINGGEFTGPVNFSFADAEINGGTFTPTGGTSAVNIDAYSSIKITGGTFVSTAEAGILVGFGSEEVTSLEITGGTFKGRDAGLFLTNITNVVLKGGKYECTNPQEGYGAIAYYDTNDNTVLARLVAEGYVYNPTLVTGNKDMFGANVIHSQAKLEVISVESTKNPSTLDNITTSVMVAVVATVGLIGTIALTKKVKAN